MKVESMLVTCPVCNEAELTVIKGKQTSCRVCDAVLRWVPTTSWPSITIDVTAPFTAIWHQGTPGTSERDRLLYTALDADGRPVGEPMMGYEAARVLRERGLDGATADGIITRIRDAAERPPARGE